MPSILKKLFSRSKDPEAAGILSSSKYGAVVASSSSDPFRQQQRLQHQQQLTKKELKKQEKLAKKEAKRHAKAQKKKDKLGSFSNNVGELPDKSKFRSAHVHNTSNAAAVDRQQAAVAAGRNNNHRRYEEANRQSRQPVESIRGEEIMVEEKENSPVGSSYHQQQQYYQQQQQQPQVLSPSSQASSAIHQSRAHKPPLNHTNQRRPSYPSPQQPPYLNNNNTPTSPTQSIDSNGESSMLRGVAIHVTNSFSTNQDTNYEHEPTDGTLPLCFSNSFDDEEYNAVALATAMGEHAAGISNNATANGASAKKSSMVDPNGDTSSPMKKKKGNGAEEKFISVLDRSPFSFRSDDGEDALFPALVGDDGDPFRQQRQQQQQRVMQQQGNSSWSPTFQDVPPPPPPPPPMDVTQQEQQPVIGFDPSFADFEPFGDSPSGFPTVSAADVAQQQQQHYQQPTTSSKSVGGQNNVTSILEETRMKRRSSRNNLNSSMGGPSDASAGGGGAPSRTNQHTNNNGGSINSAPAITSSYVRNQVQRSKNGGSISRVIDNLELHVNKRQGGAPSSSGGHRRSSSSNGGASLSGENSIRDAKERIRRENLSQDSKIIDMLAAGNTAGAAAVAASSNATNNNNSENWLFDEVTGALGPRSVAADLESLGGRSNRSGKSRNSHRSHRSKKSSRGGGGGHRRHRSKGKMSTDGSVHSGTSRNSYRSYKSTRSMVSQMSEQSRSVANDLLRLEAQLSMVGKSRREGGGSVSGSSVKSGSVVSKQRDDCGASVTSRDYSVGRASSHHSSRQHISASARKAAVRSLRSKVTVVAPPGKLGIILANRTDSRGTVVSGVRTASVLATQVNPGDRIIAIDDEDVSQMNVKEITTIMARKSEFERVLTLLAAPKMQYD